MAFNPQPACASAQGGPVLGRTLGSVTAGIGVVGGIVGAVSTISATSAIRDIAFLDTAWFSAGAGPGVTLAAASGALVGAAIGLAIVFSKALDRLNAIPGVNRCYSGVVNGISRPFRSIEDHLAPWGAQHTRVDVVVKGTYWPLITAAPAAYNWCAADMRSSPLIRSYFYSTQVRAAVRGAMAGAVVGAIGGAIVGYFAGVGIAAAIGSAACAGSLVFYLLCLLLVIVVALVVALVLTLVSALVGGGIGAGTAGPGARPTAGGSSAPVEIALGQYITLNANLAVYGEDNDAWVGWWVDTTTVNRTPVLHGVSTAGEGIGGGTPFTFVDADNGFTDACSV